MKRLLIDGFESDLSKLVCSPMSLSSSRAEMDKHHFELFLGKSDLISDFSLRYCEWVEQSKAEDENHGGPDSDDIIGVAGYPNLEQILDDDQMSEMLFGCYLVEEVIQKYGCSDYEVIEYWLDEIKTATVTDTGIKLHGICFSKRKS